MRCVMQAWHKHEAELRRWLVAKLGNAADAEDMLQGIFEKAMLQGERFCSVENARAWLFQVARNAMIDSQRTRKEHVPLMNDVPCGTPHAEAVDELSECLPRVLAELPEADRSIIVHCDINGMRQRDYAQMHGLTLSAVKARLRRARKRLRTRLEQGCQVRRDESGKVCCFVPRAPMK